jgi:hypothetical protein
MVTQQMKADLAARGFTPEQIRNMPPKAAQAILREQYAAEPPAAAGIGRLTDAGYLAVEAAAYGRPDAASCA